MSEEWTSRFAPADVAAIKNNRFRTLAWTALRLRCPICKRGSIFPTWLSFTPKCPYCGVNIEREAGYFLGSIYFNYGATCTLTVVLYLIGYFVFDIPNQLLLALSVSFSSCFPLFFLRYARSSFLVLDQYFQPRVPPVDPAGEPPGTRE